MKERLIILLRLYITLLLVFVTQKIVFMLVNIGYADGAPFSSCVAVLWHGLRLDSATACYILIIPFIILIVSCFVKPFNILKALKPYYFIVSLLMSVIFIADCILYSFWGAKLDANELIYAAKPKDMLASVKWWAIVAGIIAIAAITWHYFKRLCHATSPLISKKTKQEKKFLRRVMNTSKYKTVLPKLRNKWFALFFLLVGGLIFLGMRCSVTQSTANPSYVYFSKYNFCNHSALNPLFNMIHSLFKAEDLEHEFNFMTFEEAEAIVAPCFATDGNITDTLFNTTRPDILLIVWEGGGWYMTMNDSVGPNITRIARESVCFNNCYANNFRTDRGMVSILNGWMGMPTTSLMKMTDKCRKLPALAETLRKAGYTTRFTYGGDIDFTNMRAYLTETGFDEIIGYDAFPDSKKLSSWGSPDAYTLVPESFSFMSKKDNNPTFDVILTLSSHEPWEVPMQKLSNQRMNSFAYADSCIGVLIDKLRNTPQWNNLLVVIVADHGCSDPQSNLVVRDPVVAHIPLLMFGGAIKEPREVDLLLNQSDIAATLLSQLGIDASQFTFSRNVFSPKFQSLRHFAMHAYKNAFNLIEPSGVTSFDCVDYATDTVSGTPSKDSPEFSKALIQYIYQRTARL